MEKTNIVKAIYQAILKIRAGHNRPHAENISKAAAKSLGLTKEQVKKHLESLVETGAVYISQTTKGDDSYFILDVSKLGVCDDKEPDGENFDSDCGDMENDELDLSLHNMLEGRSPVSPSRSPDTGSDRSEFLIFLDLISKLTDDVRDLNVKLADSCKKNEKLLENNYSLGLENFKLKARSNELPSREERADCSVHNNDCPSVEKPIMETQKSKIVYESIEVDVKKRNNRIRPNKKRRIREKTKATEAVNVNKDGEKSKTPDKKEDSDHSSPCDVQIEKPPEQQLELQQPEQIPEQTRENLPTTSKVDTAKSAARSNKRTTVILGDSLLKNVRGWEMKKRCNKNEQIYVKCFPGATTYDLKSYCIPSIEKDPECIILHIGTNDLKSNKSEVEIAEEIVNLAKSVKNKDIEVKISGLIPRGDGLEAKRSKVNHVLHDLCNENEIEFMEHLNIDPEKHLNNSKIHLNRHGDQILENNMFMGCTKHKH